MKSKKLLLKFAIFLAIVTVFYNLIEGFVSVYFGLNDDSLALFGFGLDSFVEVISGIGIWHMVLRIKQDGNKHRDHFEKRALQITASAFYLLAIGLVISSIYNLYSGAFPDTTFWGVVIAVISIIVMWRLIRAKTQVGTALHSDAIIADANCTKACMHLSIVLLLASLSYELFDIGSIDAIGSLLIAGIAFREGKESFKKADNRKDNCCG